MRGCETNKLPWRYDFGFLENLRLPEARGLLNVGRLELPPCAVSNREHPDRLSTLIDLIYDPIDVRLLAVEQVAQFSP